MLLPDARSDDRYAHQKETQSTSTRGEGACTALLNTIYDDDHDHDDDGDDDVAAANRNTTQHLRSDICSRAYHA